VGVVCYEGFTKKRREIRVKVNPIYRSISVYLSIDRIDRWIQVDNWVKPIADRGVPSGRR